MPAVNYVQTTVYLTPMQRHWLRKQEREQEVTRSFVIRELIDKARSSSAEKETTSETHSNG